MKPLDSVIFANLQAYDEQLIMKKGSGPGNAVYIMISPAPVVGLSFVRHVWLKSCLALQLKLFEEQVQVVRRWYFF